MNIENLNNLIVRLDTLAVSKIYMGTYADDVITDSGCGTCGCIAGWAIALRDGRYDPASFDGIEHEAAANYLGINCEASIELFYPHRNSDPEVYPSHRVIATLKRLRDTYLTTGNIVVDWGPEPGEEPKTPWVAPQVAEIIAPALPAEITGLLRPSPAKTEV